MNTIKINDKKGCKMIAHRGVSGLECENTAAAFVAAGNRSYFGIETDVHLTRDEKFAIIHDANAKRTSGIDANVEELPFSAVSDMRHIDREYGIPRRDLVIPELNEYIRICKRYEKASVLELKCPYTEEAFRRMIEEIRSFDYLDSTIFISFYPENLTLLKSIYPEVCAQFLTTEWNDKVCAFIKEGGFGLDIQYTAVTRELVDLIHSNGKEINCWTVNELSDAERLIEMGVDYITTNILE